MMEQQIKRIKSTKGSVITDIASSIDHIANSVKSISESYNDILRINTAVVTYLQNAERHENAINESTKDVEHTSVREER